MIFFLNCDKDTFITNKIIKNSFRATDANSGRAGTLDLFKLYDESVLSCSSPYIIDNNGKTRAIENSRILLSFDFDKIRELTGSDGLFSNNRLSEATFTLKMFNIYHDDTVPSNFNVVLFPLSKSWDEGPGIDNYQFCDLGSCNWATASGMTSTWEMTGAMSGGFPGQTDIDYLTGSETLGNLFAVQSFDDGSEDLSIDITTICSATIANQISDEGFILAFSGTEESDIYSRWIKRFYSRHTKWKEYSPRIEVKVNDVLQDNRENFVFDYTGSLFFYNRVRGELTTVISGGVDQTSLNVEIKAFASSSGSSLFSTTVSANEITTGIYSCSFAIDSFQTELTGQIVSNGSASFYDYWKNTDGTKAYMTGTFDINEALRTSYKKEKRYNINITNLKKEYYKDEDIRMRVFVNEVSFVADSSKLPNELESLIVDKLYYKIRNNNSNEVLVQFDDTYTKASYDEVGMYFDLKLTGDVFVPGELYVIEFKIDEDGVEQIFEDTFRFKLIQ